MHNYDFSTLNDKEFEALTADLLSCRYGVKIERFKPGKDSGVDGRWFRSDGGEIVVQCKHWLRSGVDALIQRLRTSEIEKVRKLNPVRYILTTSVPLSRHNKREIKKALDPYITQEDDIIGPETLNDLLANYPEIERRHYKLWLTSATTLSIILNNAVFGRSKAELIDIKNEASVYAPTSDFSRACTHIEKHRILLLTGDPGIGKTTLARQVVLHHVAAEYEFIDIQQDIQEAEAVYAEDRRQIFYYDDFLGRTYLEAIRPKQDSHVLAFMRRVARDPKKRFVLTSRTNILNQGAALSDSYTAPLIESNIYRLEVGELTLLDRGRILYNHIWHSRLPESHVDELYRDRRYITICKHDNFNPRLVSFVVDSDKVGDLQENEYWKYVSDTLANPEAIWDHFFTAQLDQDCKDLVIFTVISGKQIDEEVLRKAFYSINTESGRTRAEQALAFRAACRQATGSVLIRSLYTTHIEYDIFNPSIADYVQAMLTETRLWTHYLLHIRNVDALTQLRQMRKRSVIPAYFYHDAMVAIANAERQRNDSRDDYSLMFARMVAFNEAIRQDFGDLVRAWIVSPDPSSVSHHVVEAIEIFTSWEWFITRDEAVSYCDAAVRCFIDAGLPIDNRDCLNNLLWELDSLNATDTAQKLRGAIVNEWENCIAEKVNGEDFITSLESDDQKSEALESLKDYIRDNVDLNGVDLTNHEIDRLCAQVDFYDVISRNREMRSRSEDRVYSRRSQDVQEVEGLEQAVDDLFERD